MIFENVHNWPLEHWHVELCSKCSLKCPRCSRQEMPEGLTNTELTLDWFKSNFTGLLIDKIKKLTLCGDDGDPIYAKELLPLLKWFREHNRDVQFVIVTNGSYKTKKWWQELASILNERDHIHFSIDGWDQQSNNMYRINCDWESIMEGIDVLQNTSAYKTWATIAFKFNEQHIEKIKSIAKEKKFDAFQLTLSTKFNATNPMYPTNDPLQPSDKYIANDRFTRQTTRLTNKIWNDNCRDLHLKRFKNTPMQKQVIPLCMIGNKGLYINAKGKFFPCCWTGLRYEHNQEVLDYIDQNRSLGEILDDDRWRKFFLRLQLKNSPKECLTKCATQKWSEEHATNW